MNGNVLKGLLLNVGDSTITVYPGKLRDWKAHLDPVTFNYLQIQRVQLLLKKVKLNGLLTGGRRMKKANINGNINVFNEFKIRYDAKQKN